VADLKNIAKRMKRHCTAINNILEEVQEEFPDATLYLSGGEVLHLLSGDSHDGDGTAHRDREIASARLYASGGDW
jgi:hypothetical protein